MNDLEQLLKRVDGCELCQFNNGRTHLHGEGKPSSVMFIAESPSTSVKKGNQETSKNFYNTDADKLFEEVRLKCGLQDSYLTDFVKCGVASGKPTKESIDNCLVYLKEEVRLVNPKVIVAVGKFFSIQVAPNKRKSVEFAGFISDKLQTQIPVISTYHYSFIWRWKKIKGNGIGSSKLAQIKPEWKEIYENQHREILKYI